MAIHIIKDNYKNDDNQDASTVEIANGDLRALNEVVESYGVNDITDIIAFGIAVMLEADGKPITVINKDGLVRRLMPAESLKKNGGKR